MPRRTTRWGVTLGAALALAFSGGMPALAAATPAQIRTQDPDEQKRSVDQQLGDLREQLKDTEASLADAYIALRTTEAQLPAAKAAVDKALAELKAAEAADAQAAADLSLARANEQKAIEELAATTDQISQGRGRVAAFAGQVYMEQGMGSLNMAVDASSPQQLADRLALVGAVMDAQHSTLSKLATAKASQVAQEAHVTALRADSEEAKLAAEEAVRARQTAKASADSAKASLDQLAATQRSQADVVQAQVDGQRQREAEMQAESDRLAEVIRIAAEEARRAEEARLAAEEARRAAEAAAAAAAGQAAPAPPAPPAPQSSSSFFTWPLPGGRVTSEFGWRIHPITGSGRLHAGIDLATPCGQPIVAGADGTILSAGWAGGYGNQIVINHGFQRGVALSTSYNHMQSFAVTSGQVRRGQVIGYEGTTGFSTGCHLHFEVYVNGSPVNPRGWL